MRRSPRSWGEATRALTAGGSGGTFGRKPKAGERSEREEGAGPADSDLVAACAEASASGNRRRSHRRPAGRRLLGRGASRPGGPRPDVLRRRQADDRLRLRFRRRGGDRAPAGWQDRRSRKHARHRLRLRPRPLQPQRHPRHELLRRRQADDRLRELRTQANGGGAPGRRQDRRGRLRGSSDGFALARYNPNGSLDTTLLRRRQADDRLREAFDRGERRWRSRATARSSWSAPAVTGGDFALARYNPNGSLDTTFSGDGKQTTDFGGLDEANAVALQADGKIVVVGREGGNDFALARYNPNGSLDTSFSGDGKQTTDFGGLRRRERRWRSRPTARSSRPAPRGGIDGDFALARYNPNGSLDTSFSGDGKQTTDFGASTRERGGAPGRRQDRRGRTAATAASFALARYNPNGSLDTELLGRRQADHRLRGRFDGANAVALQGDGKIVAVGFGGLTIRLRARPLQRRTARSTPPSPVTASRRPASQGFDEANGVALQGDGKIVAVGGTGPTSRAAPSTSPSPATTPTARSTRASRATAGRRPTSGSSRRRAGWRSRATARSSWWAAPVAASAPPRRCPTTSPSPATTRTVRWTPPSRVTASRPRPSGPTASTTSTPRPPWRSRRRQDRRGRLQLQRHRLRLRPRPLQPQRLARHDLLRRRQADDGLRRGDDRAPGMVLQTNGKIVVAGRAGDDFALARYNTNGSLRHDLLRRWRADDRLRRLRRRERGGAPGGRQDRRGGLHRRWRQQRLRPRPLQPERLARHDLLRRRQADDRLRGLRSCRTGWRIKSTGRIIVAGGVVGARPGKKIARTMPKSVATWYGPDASASAPPAARGCRPQTIGVAHRNLPCGTKVTLKYRAATSGQGDRPRPVHEGRPLGPDQEERLESCTCTRRDPRRADRCTRRPDPAADQRPLGGGGAAGRIDGSDWSCGRAAALAIRLWNSFSATCATASRISSSLQSTSRASSSR